MTTHLAAAGLSTPGSLMNALFSTTGNPPSSVSMPSPTSSASLNRPHRHLRQEPPQRLRRTPRAVPHRLDEREQRATQRPLEHALRGDVRLDGVVRGVADARGLDRGGAQRRVAASHTTFLTLCIKFSSSFSCPERWYSDPGNSALRAR